MKIIQKYLDFRQHLATINDSVTGEETARYPKISLFMLIDIILLEATAFSSTLAWACRAWNPIRFPNLCDRFYVIIIGIPALIIGAVLSSTGNFKKWRHTGWLAMILLYPNFMVTLSVIIKTEFATTLPAIFHLTIASWIIDIDLTLIIAHLSFVLWYLNSILMYRYKVHLYRQMTFVTRYNVPLRR